MGENTTTGEKPKLKHDYGKIDFEIGRAHV